MSDKIPQNCRKIVAKLSHNCLLSRNCRKIVAQLCVVVKLSQNCRKIAAQLRVDAKLSQTCRKENVCKISANMCCKHASQNCPKIVANWQQIYVVLHRYRRGVSNSVLMYTHTASWRLQTRSCGHSQDIRHAIYSIAHAHSARPRWNGD